MTTERTGEIFRRISAVLLGSIHKKTAHEQAAYYTAGRLGHQSVRRAWSIAPLLLYQISGSRLHGIYK